MPASSASVSDSFGLNWASLKTALTPAALTLSTRAASSAAVGSWPTFSRMTPTSSKPKCWAKYGNASWNVTSLRFAAGIVGDLRLELGIEGVERARRRPRRSRRSVALPAGSSSVSLAAIFGHVVLRDERRVEPEVGVLLAVHGEDRDARRRARAAASRRRCPTRAGRRGSRRARRRSRRSGSRRLSLPGVVRLRLVVLRADARPG